MPIDMTAAASKAVKAPPARRATKAPAQPSRPARESRDEGLQGIGQLVQGILLLGHQYADAGAIGMHWPGVATELATLADTYEAIAKPIDFLIQVGPFGALVAAALPLALQVAANHRLIDASHMSGSNVVPPEVLESQMKANVARMQADAMRAQQEAIRDARQAQADYEQMMSKPENNGTREYAAVSV